VGAEAREQRLGETVRLMDVVNHEQERGALVRERDDGLGQRLEQALEGGRDGQARRLALLTHGVELEERRLDADEQPVPGPHDALGRVHFERIAIAPDGRPSIRHMGGSVVWVLFPPIVRATPLPEGQPEALVAALDEFARAGERL